jgi:hypothetical protein
MSAKPQLAGQTVVVIGGIWARIEGRGDAPWPCNYSAVHWNCL